MKNALNRFYEFLVNWADNIYAYRKHTYKHGWY